MRIFSRLDFMIAGRQSDVSCEVLKVKIHYAPLAATNMPC
jgi:hypothetical protein